MLRHPVFKSYMTVNAEASCVSKSYMTVHAELFFVLASYMTVRAEALPKCVIHRGLSSPADQAPLSTSTTSEIYSCCTVPCCSALLQQPLSSTLLVLLCRTERCVHCVALALMLPSCCTVLYPTGLHYRNFHPLCSTAFTHTHSCTHTHKHTRTHTHARTHTHLHTHTYTHIHTHTHNRHTHKHTRTHTHAHTHTHLHTHAHTHTHTRTHMHTFAHTHKHTHTSVTTTLVFSSCSTVLCQPTRTWCQSWSNKRKQSCTTVLGSQSRTSQAR